MAKSAPHRKPGFGEGATTIRSGRIAEPGQREGEVAFVRGVPRAQLKPALREHRLGRLGPELAADFSADRLASFEVDLQIDSAQVDAMAVARAQVHLDLLLVAVE